MDPSVKWGHNSGVKTKEGIHVRKMAAAETFSPIMQVVGDKKAVIWWGFFKKEDVGLLGCHGLSDGLGGQECVCPLNMYECY